MRDRTRLPAGMAGYYALTQTTSDLLAGRSLMHGLNVPPRAVAPARVDCPQHGPYPPGRQRLLRLHHARPRAPAFHNHIPYYGDFARLDCPRQRQPRACVRVAAVASLAVSSCEHFRDWRGLRPGVDRGQPAVVLTGL